MTDLEFPQVVQSVANDVLVWVGFGTLVGLLAKAIMPGRDPGGTVATLVMGIGGTVMGCGTLMFFYDNGRVTPISPIGFLVGTAGSFLILFFYRMLGGYFFHEGPPLPPGVAPPRSFYRRRARRRDDLVPYDE